MAGRPHVPETRNPFRGKGLAITLALLLHPAERWSLAQLADMAEVSRPLVSLVLRELRSRELVSGEVTRGRAAAVRARPELFWETSRSAHVPVLGVVGGRVPPDRPTGGGPVVSAGLGVPWQAPPRVYVRSVEEFPRVLARSGGWWAGDQPPDWEVAVVDSPLPPGPVPSILAALELGTTSRGRETLEAYAFRVLTGFAEAGRGAA